MFFILKYFKILFFYKNETVFYLIQDNYITKLERVAFKNENDDVNLNFIWNRATHNGGFIFNFTLYNSLTLFY